MVATATAAIAPLGAPLKRVYASAALRRSLPYAAAVTYRRFLLVRLGGLLALLGVVFLVFERDLWLHACISLIVGLVLLAGSARMER